MDRLDYIESEARANAAFHIAGAEVLQKESNTLLNVLLAAQGGGIGLLAALLQRETLLVWQMGALLAGVAYLFVVSLVVVMRCLWARDLYPPANEPGNMQVDGVGLLDDLRRAQLKTAQDMIDLNRRRNESVAWWLNRSRLAAAAVVPVVMGVAFVLYCLVPDHVSLVLEGVVFRRWS